MQPKPQINVRSRATKIVKVETALGDVTPTAEWAVKFPTFHVISFDAKAVKLNSSKSVDLTKVNRALRGKREISPVATSQADALETA